MDSQAAIEANVDVGDLLVEVGGRSVKERSVEEVFDYIRQVK